MTAGHTSQPSAASHRFPGPSPDAPAYAFVGGPFDGRQMPVTPPPEPGAELVVHTVGQPVPAEFYVLRPDGRFHHAPTPGGRISGLFVS